MVLGLGIDLLQNSRVERELARGAWRSDDGIFTAGELSFCDSGRRPALRYAACFAAKEATLKALGIAVENLGMFRDVEIGPGPNGSYQVVLHNRPLAESEQLGVKHIRLSVTSSRIHTGALVILED